MKKLLSFICAVLIAVFAVMPNADAEEQKTYGNLDMNRWSVLAPLEDRVILVDRDSFDYKSAYQNNYLCNLWICYFYNNEDKYMLHNLTVNYQDKSINLERYIEYSKEGKVLDSYTYPYDRFEKVVPNSIGELFYYVAFYPEYMENIKEHVREKEGK